METGNNQASPIRTNLHLLLSTLSAFSLVAWVVLVVVFIALVVAGAWLLYWSLRDDSPTFTSTGPTVVQLERLQLLVSSRVHIADILTGESKWLEGSWVVAGDALIGVDMKHAEIRGKDDEKRTAVIVLPPPQAISARVNHERTRQWNIKNKSWIPFADVFLGDPKKMQNEAMLEAQRLINRAASSTENIEQSRRNTEGILHAFYDAVDWHVSVQWK